MSDQTKTPIEYTDIKKGDLIRSEFSGEESDTGSIRAVEYVAAYDQQRQFDKGGTFFRLRPPLPTGQFAVIRIDGLVPMILEGDAWSFATLTAGPANGRMSEEEVYKRAAGLRRGEPKKITVLYEGLDPEGDD